MGAITSAPASAQRTRTPIEQGRREGIAIAGFGTWMIIGLFLDGWAHGANKPESFFTPWHGVLYSGFVAAVAFFVIDGIRHPAADRADLVSDKLAPLGLVLFATGAIGDGVWHSIFGVEVDLEALLSPTHLLLMTGGLFMLTAPLRWALRYGDDAIGPRPTFAEFAPVLASLTLASALATFFTMYLSGDDPIAAGLTDLGQAHGIASVLARNLLLMAPAAFILRRWRAPLGTFTIMFGLNGVLMAAIDGFDNWELGAPFVIGGVVGDALATRLPLRVFAAVVPVATWAAYFAGHELGYGVTWSAELWVGAIFLAALSSYALAVLMTPSDVSMTSRSLTRV